MQCHHVRCLISLILLPFLSPGACIACRNSDGGRLGAIESKVAGIASGQDENLIEMVPRHWRDRQTSAARESRTVSPESRSRDPYHFEVGISPWGWTDARVLHPSLHPSLFPPSSPPPFHNLSLPRDPQEARTQEGIHGSYMVARTLAVQEGTPQYLPVPLPSMDMVSKTGHLQRVALASTSASHDVLIVSLRPDPLTRI